MSKTSLCSFFRRRGAGPDGCSHGEGCRYAHTEEELRPRPDGTWDPTSYRAKKLQKVSEEDAYEEEEVTIDETSLDKCLLGLSRHWVTDKLKAFLEEQGISYAAAKKKKGMTVGFVTFGNIEQLTNAVEVLKENRSGGKEMKIVDANRRSHQKLSGNGAATENSVAAAPADGTSGLEAAVVASIRTVRDAVTPLAHMTYKDQLEHKKNSVAQLLKKLTRNAKKACPYGVPLPEWISEAKQIGGLSCKLEGILESPVIDGYRNKCEFSVGHSLAGKKTVGFMLGNFREGVTAVEEPVDCPNVSGISSKYAFMFQDFLQSSTLPVWNRVDNSGFWRQFTVREGRSPAQAVVAQDAETQISEVMIIVQVCSTGIDELLMKDEFAKLSMTLVQGAATCSPPLPLTTIVVQDHTGISNVAAADCPLIPLLVRKVGQSEEGAVDQTRIHDHISNLRFSLSPTAFFQVWLKCELLRHLGFVVKFGDILKAGPKLGSSFTWQSVIAGLATFKRGYVWRVGNGEKINIWLDPWIPNSPNKKVISRRGGSNITKVCDLISPITGGWNEEMLSELFNTVDKNRIMQIPLHQQGFDDFIAWGFTKHGRYTVRSGYHMQWRHQFGTRQFVLPGSSANNPVWKILWKLQIPSKIKIFIWRALHGIIPLKCILANRHIGNSSECPICKQGPEDIQHLLFLCPTAQDLWTQLGLQDVINEATLEDRSGSSTLEVLLRRQDNDYMGFDHVWLKEVISITSWYLWWMRRRRTHDEAVPPVFKCKMSILGIAANAAKATHPIADEVKWNKPETRQVKVNVDATFHSDTFSGAVGVVARDYQGQFVAAACKFLPHVVSASMAEALAMKEGLNLAIKMGCNSIVAEGDSLETINACSGEDTWWMESAAVYADCVDATTIIGKVIYQFCPREANKVADDIARFCFQNKITCTWDDDPPSFLLNSLVNDITVL